MKIPVRHLSFDTLPETMENKEYVLLMKGLSFDMPLYLNDDDGISSSLQT